MTDRARAWIRDQLVRLGVDGPGATVDLTGGTPARHTLEYEDDEPEEARAPRTAREFVAEVMAQDPGEFEAEQGMSQAAYLAAFAAATPADQERALAEAGYELDEPIGWRDVPVESEVSHVQAYLDRRVEESRAEREGRST